MRILFVSTMHGPKWGGSEELWSQAAIRLKRTGHDVMASILHRPQQPEEVISLAANGVEVDEYFLWYQTGRARRVWNKLSLENGRRIARMKRFNPDLVVISQGHNSGGFEWAKICREASIQYVLIVHCNGDHWWLGEQVNEAVASYINANRIFCVSRGNLELLRLQVGEPLLNAEVVRNPYNVSPEISPTWPVEDGNLRIACVARLEVAAKGQELLLQTLALPEWCGLPVQLNLYGDGPDQLALRRLALMLHLKNVHFCGHVPDIGAVWDENHLLVLPSRYEGLPLALVEAMWCARPAVVTDVGGNTELCIDGETGFVAPAPTLALFSSALMRAWNRRTEWPQLGQAARRLVESQVPKDPVAVFCDRLKSWAART